ncbi:zinc finger and SCAN domain-containing protein 21-like [Phyllopteryx taeniolatus]|uniref:zinc finger and SCAN domain-containing protein 21-like n=1 Tax=Phyllopteryx taeniolatus TaxID=161469 RepID=UPI002AD3CAAD|nr:zinc finger and SCAN domain-containing protein 21-like [Phyllopteryx taeniolatus]
MTSRLPQKTTANSEAFGLKDQMAFHAQGEKEKSLSVRLFRLAPTVAAVVRCRVRSAVTFCHRQQGLTAPGADVVNPGHDRSDVSENLHPERQQSVSPHNKEGDEEFLHVTDEEQEEIIKVPSTGVPLKSEDEGQSEERRWAEPPSSSSSQHMTTEGDGDLCGGSQADGLLAPLSDSDDMTSHSPHTKDDDVDEQSEGDMTGHTANKRWKCSFASMSNFKQHKKIHTGEKDFVCSVCGQRFSVKGSPVRNLLLAQLVEKGSP